MTPRYIRLGGLALGALTVLIATAVGLRGCSTQTSAVPWASGTTVIPGTFGWDVETDSIVNPLSVPVADFWWETISESQRYLTPMHGAAAAVVTGKAYEQIDAAFVDHRWMRTKKIDAGDKVDMLDPGTIIVFRTADGTLGKLQVIGYRRLHDLSFPQANVYSDTQKSAIAQHPDVERYHLEITWQLYRAP